MRRVLMVVGLIVFCCCLDTSSSAQETATPTPTPTLTSTPTHTPTPEPWIYATLAPESTDEPGQQTRFDYVATVGDVQISNLLTWQLYSMWAMFLFGLFLYWRKRK